VFCSLVLAASMMPVERLPAASWQTACLGFVSAVFDNIPLTALALRRAATTGASRHAVGYGGSMVCSVLGGVAVTNVFPKISGAVPGWHVALPMSSALPC
jgi:hypothetical protein